jgi:hypothetical protein
MRLCLALVLAGALAVPALGLSAAAEVNPQALVLRQADVPAGFRLDRDDSGVRTNEEEAGSEPRFRRLFRSWGRLTGYEAEFDRQAAAISCRADLFRGARGAAALLAFFDREIRRQPPSAFRRRTVGVGDGGFVYRGESQSPFVAVIWRQGRVFGGVAVFGLAEKVALRLARAQDRRIAAALRG